jgi:hypothetical protein
MIKGKRKKSRVGKPRFVKKRLDSASGHKVLKQSLFVHDQRRRRFQKTKWLFYSAFFLFFLSARIQHATTNTTTQQYLMRLAMSVCVCMCFV